MGHIAHELPLSYVDQTFKAHFFTLFLPSLITSRAELIVASASRSGGSSNSIESIRDIEVSLLPTCTLGSLPNHGRVWRCGLCLKPRCATEHVYIMQRSFSKLTDSDKFSRVDSLVSSVMNLNAISLVVDRQIS